MSKTVLKVDQVGMKFNLNSEKVDDLKDYIIKFLKHQLMYKEFWALKEISFEVQEGDRVGILGLNGAGKSTTIECILGTKNADSGTVSVLGYNPKKDRHRLFQNVGVQFQEGDYQLAFDYGIDFEYRLVGWWDCEKHEKRECDCLYFVFPHAAFFGCDTSL